MMLKGLRVSGFGFRVKGSGVEGVRGGEGVRDKGLKG